MTRKSYAARDLKLTLRFFCAVAIIATLRVVHAVYAVNDYELHGHAPRATAPLSDELARGDGPEWILSLQACSDFHSPPPRRAASPAKCTRAEAAEQERQDTAAALRKIAEQEEKALLESRQRRAALLDAAIDCFNFEKYDRAESYSRQVLAEDPDNSVAKDILANARRARHRWINENMLADLKESYRRWQVGIEWIHVPNGKTLAWPPQSFWDKMHRGPAIKNVGGAEPEMSEEEIGVLNTLKTRRIDLRFDAALFPTVLGDLVAASSVHFVIDADAWEDLESAKISLKARGVTVHDALQLIMLQASAEGEVVWEITGHIVRFRGRHARESAE